MSGGHGGTKVGVSVSGHELSGRSQSLCIFPKVLGEAVCVHVQGQGLT